MSVRPINNQFAGMRANPIDLDGASHYPKVWHLPHWKKGDDKGRIAVLREIAMRGGRDPRIATLCVNIFKAQKVVPRDYKGQAQALLKWVQKNIYYINEPSERLQDPNYTIKVGYGDCDDMAILLASMFEACRLEWRYVLSGKLNGKSVRWIEGQKLPKNVKWSHIYLVVGYPPFQPKKWLFAEPTLSHVNLGWDIIQSEQRGEKNILPEMAGTYLKAKNGRILKQVDEKVAKKEEEKTRLFSKIKDRLKPSNLAVDVIIGAITAVLVGKAVQIIEKNVFGKSK